MPELPDIEAYRVALECTVVGQVLTGVRIASPFLVRTVDPPVSAAVDATVTEIRRLGKRLVFALRTPPPDKAIPRALTWPGAAYDAAGPEPLFLVLHLMIAGRLRWRAAGIGIPRKLGLAAYDFEHGTLHFTEAGSKKRASLHVVQGETALAALDPGGLDVFAASAEQFAATLRSESHTLKRALTDPGLFSGIGNAYSDEILHRARMSPFRITTAMSDAEIEALRQAVVTTLAEWTERLCAQAAAAFPENVTAFHPEMAVHGRYGQPCPVCGQPVQHVVYAQNEMNYCARCQTEGRLMADRSLSRLLKSDWPRTIEELEAMKRRLGNPKIAG